MEDNHIVHKLTHPVSGEHIYYPRGKTQAHFEAALNFKAEEGDVYICSYPKSGTTWLQHIVWLIVHPGQEYVKGSQKISIPFIDFEEEGLAERFKATGLDKRVFKSHLPQKWVPYHQGAKYLYVARNPKDFLPSWSNHLRGFEKYAGSDVSVQNLFKLHMADEVPYNGQLQHIGEWYQKRNENNVLFLYYKDMKSDLKKEVIKIAEFLGDEYLNKLKENDEKLLKEVVEKSTFESMSKLPKETWVTQERRADSPFIRKGVVGDYKNHLNDEQIAEMDNKWGLKGKKYGIEHMWD